MKKKQKPTAAFLTHDWSWGTNPLQPNGCAWYRCKLPSDELNKRGWVSSVGFPAFSTKRGFGLLIEGNRAVHGWDVIVFKLLMQQEVLDAIPIAQALGQKIVVDVDDWFDGLAKTNRAYETTDPQKNPKSNREIYSKIIMSANAVITSTPFLFEYYGKLRDNVFLVRNGIDINRWKRRIDRGNKKLRIGWVGATHWRSNDLEQLSEWIGQYIEMRNVLFHHSGHAEGAPLANEMMKINQKLTKTMPMTPILNYPSLFSPIDIGLIPLNDIPFNHAKSFIKGLEYAAAGVPFVSSYSPEYQYLSDHGVGRIARTKSEWIYHLDELMDGKMRSDEVSVNYENLKQFHMSNRGDDWEATMSFIKDKI